MMTKITGILKAFLAVAVVVVMMIGGVSVNAGVFAAPIEPKANDTSALPEIRVVGYKIVNSADSSGDTKDQIFKNNNLSVVLDIIDTREGRGEKLQAKINTDSFLLDANNGKIDGVTTGDRTRITFMNMTYTGIGKTFRCAIFYDDAALPIYTYEFDIHQCVEYVPPASSESTSSSSSSAVVKGTGFVLKEASYGQSIIYAGQPFTLSVTLLATNGDHSVENVTLGITPAKELALQDGSSLSYVGTIKPGQSIPAEFKLVPGANVEAGSYTVVIDIKGVDAKKGDAVSAQVSISVPVTQPERFEIFNTQLPTDISAGTNDGSGMGNITLVNQGKGSVSNVAVDVKGDGLTLEEGKQYLGHIAGGEQKVADFNILASKAGPVNATVVVSYENTAGEKKELAYDFSITVEESMDMGMDGMGDFDMSQLQPETSGGVPLWVWGLTIVGALAVAVVVIVLVKRRKAKKAAALEDDYDEDE